jgi:hypothetical protein
LVIKQSKDIYILTKSSLVAYKIETCGILKIVLVLGNTIFAN